MKLPELFHEGGGFLIHKLGFSVYLILKFGIRIIACDVIFVIYPLYITFKKYIMKIQC